MEKSLANRRVIDKSIRSINKYESLLNSSLSELSRVLSSLLPVSLTMSQEYSEFGVQVQAGDGLVCYFDENLIKVDTLLSLLDEEGLSFRDVLLNTL